MSATCGDHWDAWQPSTWCTSHLLHRRAPHALISASTAALQLDAAGRVASGILHEKYHASVMGCAGLGGEYPSQEGFGWSIGVALEVMGRRELWVDRSEDIFGQIGSKGRIWVMGGPEGKGSV